MTGRALTVVLVALAALFGARLAFAGDVPAQRGLVTDEANVIDDAEERALATRLTDFERRTGIEVAVVTVKSLDGFSVEAYTTKVRGAWSAGKARPDDAVVVLVAPNDRKTRIQFGPALRGTLNDAACAAIADREMIPAIASGRTSEGVIAGADAVLRALDSKRPATAPSQRPHSSPVPAARSDTKDESASVALVATLGLGALAGVVALVVVLVRRGSRSGRLQGTAAKRTVNDPHAARPATQDAAAADAVLMAQLLHLPTTNNAAASAGAADPTPGPDAGSFDSAGGADFSGGDGGASGSW